MNVVQTIIKVVMIFFVVFRIIHKLCPGSNLIFCFSNFTLFFSSVDFLCLKDGKFYYRTVKVLRSRKM